MNMLESIFAPVFVGFSAGVRAGVPKLIVAALAAAMVALGASAAPTVTIVGAQQRYPWNGLVDVTYTLSGIEEGQYYELRFEVTPPGGTARVSDPAAGATYSNGTWKATFNAAAILPETFAKGCSLKAVLEPLAVPPDATGKSIGILGDVMIIDVSGGKNASVYPVTYCANADIGRFNCPVYKTDKIVLRKVSAGSYVVGDDGEEDNPRRAVTTRGFYLGVFEVTQQQYLNVMGLNPSCFDGNSTDGSDARQLPADHMSWNALRGSTASDLPLQPNGTSGSFLKRLSAKAQDANGAVTGFDLPTEWQWEIACRAGTTTRYYWGNGQVDIGRYAWYGDNSGETTQIAGGRQPNAWGFFDMVGNVLELCRDAYQERVTDTDADDVASSGAYRAARGGCWSDDVSSCTSSYRNYITPSLAYYDYGFRIFKALP